MPKTLGSIATRDVRQVIKVGPRRLHLQSSEGGSTASFLAYADSTGPISVAKVCENGHVSLKFCVHVGDRRFPSDPTYGVAQLPRRALRMKATLTIVSHDTAEEPAS